MALFMTLSSCLFENGASQIPTVIYLGWDVDEQNQLYVLKPDNEPKQVSDVEYGIHDFELGPDGRSIVYSTVSPGGASQLWKTTVDGDREQLLLTCQDAECSFPVWAEGSRRLIYERRPIGPDGSRGLPSLWWLDVETGETTTVLEDGGAAGASASVSTDGQWLSYYSPEEQGLVVYNFVDGRSRFVADAIGAPAAWSPTGDQLLLPKLDVVIIHGDERTDHLDHTHDYQSATHLFKVDLGADETENISGERPVEDSVPAWSPDGTSIAFGRRFAGTAAGRQLWLMKADGSEQTAVADDPIATYGPPLWSPDGRYLLAQRYVIDDSEKYPSIWLFDLESGRSEELIAQAMQPGWVVYQSND